jgi:hypothetical protein
LTARGMWDEAKHFRGYHGRWAAGADRSPENRAGRAASAFHPRTPASARRREVAQVVDRVHGIHGVFAARDRGQRLSWEQRLKVEYASPTKRAEAIRATGSPVMPLREALHREVRSARGHKTPRVGVKRTFTGKKLAVRAHAPVPGVRRTGEARRLMGRD